MYNTNAFIGIGNIRKIAWLRKKSKSYDFFNDKSTSLWSIVSSISYAVIGTPNISNVSSVGGI